MRLLTYNLWHGLSPSTPVAFEALEPVARRKLREQMQIELLRDTGPDLCFFQECNPVVKRAPALAKALNMEQCFQPDLVGTKLFGVGFPMNLNSGLAIMAAAKWGLKKIGGLSLSRPGANLVHSWGSWQLKEERFALFAETLLPGWGRVLLVDTHLHHGLESTAAILTDLEKAGKDLELSDNILNEVKMRLLRGNEKRAQEFAVLMAAVHDLQARYETVVIAGDLNVTPGSELGSILQQNGFQDVWMAANGEAPGYSFDGEKNKANHVMTARFPLTLVVEDLSFSVKVKDALLEMARRHESKPRRIDYLWLRSNSGRLKVKTARLVGLPSADGMAPSDHFGVCADIEVL